MTGSRDEHAVLTSNSDETQQDEDVLRDVLDELDRERTRRAELEAQMRKLSEEKDQLKISYEEAKSKLKNQEELIAKLQSEMEVNKVVQEEEGKEMSRRAFLAMETQVMEYQSLVDELTKGKPAIAAAASASETRSNQFKRQTKATTLPLYVVRLLEILPWTPHAQEHVFAREDIFEWQYYDNREHQWTSNVRAFPHFFRSLPIVRPKQGKKIEDTTPREKDRGLLLFLAGGVGKNHPTAPSKQGVLTDEQMTRILSVQDGYPLPEDSGTWEWIGGWRIEKRVSTQKSGSGSPKQKVDCDEEGWSYAQEADHFKVNPTEWVWDNPGEEVAVESSGKVEFQRKLRRRKWTRQRVLVDYPYACEQTKEYLKLVAENARLTVTTNKISDQLVETKTALTENEEVLMTVRSQAALQIARLRSGVDLMGEPPTDGPRPNEASSSGNPIQDFISKNEQMKGIGSKISQWVKAGRSNSPVPTPTSGTVANIPASSEPQSQTAGDSTEKDSPGGFDWKKVGRVFNKGGGQNSEQDRTTPKGSKILEKLGESVQRHSSEGSSTDESVEDAMEVQE